MRLGAPIYDKFETPDQWIAALQKQRFSAAYCPPLLQQNASDDLIAAYADAARKANIVIAEVGAWSHPLSPDAATRENSLKTCRERLALGDKLGARCVVNITSSRAAKPHNGPHPLNFTQETFDLIVEQIRGIVDAVKPTRTFYTLECHGLMYPDSADNYLALIKAVDRKAFAAHFDPVNLVSSPRLFYANGAMIRDFFKKLGPYLKGCHAKDVILDNRHLVHLDETRPGLGNLDFTAFCEELSKLDPDTPMMIEHLKTAEEYAQAADHIRAVAAKAGLAFV